MEVILKTLINGFIKIILLTKLVPLIKPMDMIMELDAVLLSNAKIVCLVKDVGLRVELESMELVNMEQL